MSASSARRYKSVTNLCKWCGVEFHPFLTRPGGQYCKLDHYYRSRAAMMVEKVCKACGGLFAVRGSIAGRYARCKACRRQAASL